MIRAFLFLALTSGAFAGDCWLYTYDPDSGSIKGLVHSAKNPGSSSGVLSVSAGPPDDLVDERGVFRYLVQGGAVVARSAGGVAADGAAIDKRRSLQALHAARLDLYVWQVLVDETPGDPDIAAARDASAAVLAALRGK